VASVSRRRSSRPQGISPKFVEEAGYRGYLRFTWDVEVSWNLYRMYMDFMYGIDWDYINS
jgi:hypothetical protein